MAVSRRGDLFMRRNLVSPSPFVAFAALLGALSLSTSASAQEKPPVAPAPADNEPDHDAVVGHFAVGYFGISALPVGTTGTTTNTTGLSVAQGTIQAPVIGARYWLLPKLGIDAGVGFSDSSAGWGVAVHGGLPLALATSKHMTFELIPEATVAFTGNSANSVTYSGFRLDLGARIGGEIQFGFIGLPQLALQGTIGVYLEHDSYGLSTNSQSGSGSSTIFTTSVGSDPWGIFSDNISALYYF